MPDELKPSVENQVPEDRLANLQRDLDRLTAGVSLLGIKPCHSCGKFFRSANPATLFESRGNTICYDCLPEWWENYCGRLNATDREIAEHTLKIWLVTHHGAEVINRPEKLRKDPPPRLQIAVSCFECHASGHLGEDRCHFCDGRGSMWVVVIE
ncbi:MAG TPA: hypothetical protein VGM18_06400 [Candidatus Sulfotelmatobacter sp.]|jgi:hypothetical protein